jgi:hypothetical protein
MLLILASVMVVCVLMGLIAALIALCPQVLEKVGQIG